MQNLTVTWKHDASAGDIPAYVYYPDAVDTESHPIALIFHAGGFVLGAAHMVPKNQIGYLVAKGFVVVVPEHRLCPQVPLYDGPIQDAKDVLKWCQEDLSSLLNEKSNVQVDTSKIVAMGHSAGGQLALMLGLCPSPPLAIVDFYGPVYLSDASYSRPLPIFANIPDQPEEFIAKIEEGSQAITSKPMFVEGKPLLSDPRCAWFIKQLKYGTWLSSIIPDGDYDRVDVASQFKKGFPATYFLHGKPDVFVEYGVSVRAHEALKGLDCESELVVGDEIGHAFDLQIEETDPLFAKYVVPALDFLVKHV